MFFDNQCTLSSYLEITPLCQKGPVMLVQNELDNQLYVKKQLQYYNPEVYQQLREHPVKHTPVIYGLYQVPSEKGSEVSELVVIEEYLPASTLAELLEEKGVFSQEETLEIVMQLCRILMELHSLKTPIIHRDIKPSNVMLLPDGTVKLLDFNAAKTETSFQNRDTVLIGTAGFAAPEQYGFSSSSPQTDIYAVGVLMNVCLTGQLPAAKTADGKLRNIIRCCLEVNPKDRYQTVRELYHALKRTRQVKCEWLLPGFRTLKLSHMLGMIPVYLFILAVAFTSHPSEFRNPVAFYTYRIGIIAIGLLVVFFYGDYLHMRKFFPFMRSRSKWLRVLGWILGPLLLFFGIVLIITLVENAMV